MGRGRITIISISRSLTCNFTLTENVFCHGKKALHVNGLKNLTKGVSNSGLLIIMGMTMNAVVTACSRTIRITVPFYVTTNVTTMAILTMSLRTASEVNASFHSPERTGEPADFELMLKTSDNSIFKDDYFFYAFPFTLISFSL